ncbi:uncharacterized protein LOC110270301 [Arachis ipaensis]|uniref:uncharacterized protein LOC110270301 n=1 Tax=Arachis ipaensis TaxID=130454 RepID=UPI000A2B2C1F|nr:uncharacterized protein LOC110270301 [Arachis ipaensis]
MGLMQINKEVGLLYMMKKLCLLYPRDRPPIGLYVSEKVSDDDDPIYEYELEDLHTPVSSEDEGEKHEFPVFDEKYGFGEGRFEIGTKFVTIDGFKKVVKDMFISEGRELLWIKNDKERVRVGCRGEDCPWLAHLSYNKTLLCFQVKTYKAEHTCARDLGSNAADQHWVSKKVEKIMASQPHMTTNEAIDFFREDFNLVLHPKMVYRAVKEAKERIMAWRKAITIRPVREHQATQTGNQKRKKLRRLMKTHKTWWCFPFHNQPLNQMIKTRHRLIFLLRLVLCKKILQVMSSARMLQQQHHLLQSNLHSGLHPNCQEWRNPKPQLLPLNSDPSRQLEGPEQVQIHLQIDHQLHPKIHPRLKAPAPV